MTLRDLIFTMDTGNRNYVLTGAYVGNVPIQSIKDNPEQYRLLDREVKEWYTAEVPPKSGHMILNVWFGDRD